MARIRALKNDEIGGKLQAIYPQFSTSSGELFSPLGVAAHRPEMMKTMVDHLKSVMTTGTVERRLKEILAVKVSRLNASHACFSFYKESIKAFGVTEEEISALDDFEEYPFSDREKVALRFAEVMTVDPHLAMDDLYEGLQKHFCEEEIVELALVIGLFNYLNRFSDALQL
ncbi:MAG: carboxymuconolactone decarboxylase family protein [Candidatus Tectomicrobia bacterium]|nr:carboxymuconolactone decarboxylase family protein [Candidatus Tectomicrobia bacterium]